MVLSRRTLLAFMLSLTAATTLPAQAENKLDYTPEVLQGLVDGGQPYLLDFAASWCSTCAAQERVLNQLQAESQAYNAIPIVRVDWDQHRGGALVEALRIPRRSTLVLMQGNAEIGRVVAQTGKGVISDLLNQAS